MALVISGFALWRLKMDGLRLDDRHPRCVQLFKLAAAVQLAEGKTANAALWCLPLAAMESAGLALERKGRVRWTLPFHLVALVASLDIIAYNGPTLQMLV